jgi:hypothetical protein
MLSTPNASQVEDAHAHNRALVLRLVEILNDRDLDALPEVATVQITREAERWIGPFRESFPDFRRTVVDVITEADKVVGYGASFARPLREP